MNTESPYQTCLHPTKNSCRQFAGSIPKAAAVLISRFNAIILFVASLLPALAVQAANVSMTAADGFGGSSFNSAGKWSDTLAPHAGANYFSAAYFIRTPPDAGGITYTFAGDSLTLQAPTSSGVRSFLIKSGNNDTFIINNFTNALGGILENGGSGNVVETFTGNLWTIVGNSAVMANQGSILVGFPLAGVDGIILTNGGGNAAGITYNGNNSAFTGKFYISTVNFGNGGGATKVIFNAANSFPGNPSGSTPDQIKLEAGCTLQDNVGLTINNANGGITLAGNANLNAASTTTVGEAITDNGGGFSLTANGIGTLILSNANNTYSGGTIVSSGVLRLGLANAIPVGNITVNGSLDLNALNLTVNGLSGAGTIDSIAGGTPTFTIGNNNAGGTFTGTIQNSAGTLSLTKVGTGTQTIGSYTYGGQTLVAGGTLNMSSAGLLPSLAGDLVISNGAVLNANVAGGIALPANNFVVGTNSTVGLALATNANGINVAGGLVFQDNATNNFNYGNVLANPTGIPINVAGGFSAPGTNIVINISAVGLKVGTFTLIKYTGAALGSVANFSLNLPPGVTGTLVNNTGNDSVDVNITAIPNQLAWNGVNGTSWDLTTANWTNLVVGGITVFQQYTNGSVIAGDSVLFDDTLTNDFVNPQPTNITLAATFYAFPVTVDSTLPYSISGPGGITGSTSLVKANSGSLTLLTSNSFTGGVSVNGGALVITNDSALGATAGTVALNGGNLQINGTTTNSSRNLSLPGAGNIGVSANAAVQLGGISGAGALTKLDNGTLSLVGSNAITGVVNVNQGTLVLSPVASNNYPSQISVANSGLNGVMKITSGTVSAAKGSAPSILVGGSSGNGSLVISGGTEYLASELWLANADGSYGALTMSGGTARIGSWFAFGRGGGQGILNMNGGTLTVGGNNLTLGSFGGTTAYPFWHGVANLSGGTVNVTNGAAYIGENTSGLLNLLGGSLNILGATGLQLGRANGSLSLGIVNLLAGTITTPIVQRGSGAAAFNFNGGTLKAGAASSTFMNGLNSATIYSKGAIIDDGGFAITVPQPLLAPTGFGVSSISLASGGSGYIDTPIVTISGGSGTNATAIATVAGGVVTGITVTSPGTGYGNTDVLTVTLSGGGGSGASANTPVLAANVSGGLTKQGAGTLILSGVNTFTGPITNKAGTLSLNSASTYAGNVVVNSGTVSLTTASTINGSVTVANTATLSLAQVNSGTSTLGNMTFNGGATLGLGLTAANNPAVPLINCGTLTLTGNNTISLAGSVQIGTIKLVKALGAIAGSGNITNLTLPQGAVGSITTNFDGTYTTVSAVITSTGPGLVWTGTNSNPSLTNLWDINSTVNWLINSTATKYQQSIIPGDAVTFNDVGSGTVLLNISVGPASITLSNNAVNYTFNGAGTITGPTGLLKLGSGTATLNLTNNSYAGDTTISNGTLRIGIASAVPSSGNLTLGPTGTFEVAGVSPAVKELTGSGIVNNNSGTPATLAVGGSSGGTWNGSITNTGGGGFALHKLGSGTWVVGGQNYLNDGQPFTDRNQINGGTVIITNGGMLSVSDLELRIADGGSITSSVVVAGGTLVVTNNPLSVGINAADANGTLIVNSGMVIAGTGGAGAFAGSPNNIVVGANGATGTLIVNGGQVISSHDLWLGQNATANASLYLNGGVVQANSITYGGAIPTTYIAYFNGGTLLAATNSANFLQVYSMVMSNGLVLDDNGYRVSIGGAILQPGDAFNGGFTKKGSGTVYLDAGNTYTGATLVTNGTLAGIGSISGPLLVAPAGTLGAGDAAGIGAFTVNSDVTIQGAARLRINRDTPASDSVTVSGNITYGGSLVVSNLSTTALINGDTFQLFNVTGTKSGNFAAIVGSPGSGLAYSFDPTTGILSVVNGIASNPTNITFSVSGSTLSLSWPSDHLGWILQAQTNTLSTGLGTNWFDVPNSASVTSTNITIDVLNPSVFYRLRKP